jgi:hypothetical protein
VRCDKGGDIGRRQCDGNHDSQGEFHVAQVKEKGERMKRVSRRKRQLP